MQVKDFVKTIAADFYTGVPDSLLRPLGNYLLAAYGDDTAHHVIAADEGTAAAIGAGYYLATGRIPVVYLQNSGEGNLINPLASLLHPDVYAIPVLFVIGWRGEPGRQDAPQHLTQGAKTLPLLDCLDVPYRVLEPQTTVLELRGILQAFAPQFARGQACALVVEQGALTAEQTPEYKNGYAMTRAQAIETILAHAEADAAFFATTGKTSRELFALREERRESHAQDFLNVGAMGCASSLALGFALQTPGRRVYCLDGDGAAIMRLGALPVIGKTAPVNLVHILLDNEAHESVGGLPTAGTHMGFAAVARASRYRRVETVATPAELAQALDALHGVPGPCFLEVRCAIGARRDLGRPTLPLRESRELFMARGNHALASS